MAFHDMSSTGGVKSRASQANPNEVFIALYKTGKTDHSLTVSIRLGGEIMNELGWKRGDFVVIHEGDGPDARHIQIEKGSESSGRRLTDPSGLINDPDAARLYILSKAFALHEMPDTPQTGTACDYSIPEKGKIIVQLPSWAKPVSGTRRARSSVAKPATRMERKASVPADKRRRG